MHSVSTLAWNCCFNAPPAGNTPPRVLHSVLPPKATQGKRVIVIGDVHGCHKELQALLHKCNYTRSQDIVVQVGVSGTPASDDY